MSTDNKDVFIDQKAVDQIDAKIRESSSMSNLVMSSWGNPIEGVKEGPKGRITPPKKEEPVVVTSPVHSGQRVSTILIPSQAIKLLKQLLPLFGEVIVQLTSEQKTLLLESLQSMPTPKVMSDAQAIFKLMEALQK